MIITNLLANMIVLTFQGDVPTNTLAFQEYAFHEMYSSATRTITNWNLDLPRPVTTNMITYFHAWPYPTGLGGVIVFSNRFAFSWDFSGFPLFGDRQFTSSTFLTDDVETNDFVYEKLMQMPDLLTLQKAQKVAESAMRSAGVPVERRSFREPERKGQWKYTTKEGVVCHIPYYKFHWQSEDGFCTVDVSGITSNVVYFCYTGPTDEPYLRFLKPADYLEMLGLSANTIFVKRRLVSPDTHPTYTLYEPYHYP
jgi:hypothetical protein